MGWDNKYPYTDFHELNLDWFLQRFKEVTTQVTTLDATVQEFTAFVTNYFDNLDVQQEINNKLNTMAADGSLSALIQPLFDTYKTEIDGVVANQNTMIGGQNSRITILENRMDAFSSLAEGSTTGDAELADIRVGANGITYATAGDAVRGQFIELNDSMNVIKNNTWEDISGTGTWVVGGINPTTGIDGVSNNNIRSSNYFPLEGVRRLYMEIATGYNMSFFFYDIDKNYLYGVPTSFEESYELDIDPDHAFVRFIIGKVTPEAGDTSWSANLTIKKMYGITKTSFINKETVEALKTLDYEPLQSIGEWRVGNINAADGTNQAGSNRIRTENYIDISDMVKLHTNITSGYLYRRFFYDSNKAYIQGDQVHISGEKVMDIPAGSKYVRFQVTTQVSQSAKYYWSDEFIYNGVSIMNSDVQDLVNNYIGSGNTSYTGEKISLTDSSNMTNRCDVNEWLDMDNVAYPDITDYQFTSAQGFAVFDDYMFFCIDGGSFIVIKKSTKEILDVVPALVSSNNHNNSAQFTNIYYDDADEFPMLLASRCGTIATLDPENDRGIFYRIQRNGNDFTFSVVNTVGFDFLTRGGNWNIDPAGKEIMYIGYIKNNYMFTTDNPLIIMKFKAPEKAQIISNDPVTYQKSDCVDYMEMEHIVFQGSYANYGLIFIGVTSGSSQYVYAVRTSDKRIIAKILMPLTWEIEGLAVSNDKIFATFRSASTTNPIKIYTIDF